MKLWYKRIGVLENTKENTKRGTRDENEKFSYRFIIGDSTFV